MSKDFQIITSKLRKRIVQLAYDNKASHIGGALSIIDILFVLYSEILKVENENPDCRLRDKLFYSKGHACLALYVTLEHFNFFKDLDLNTFAQNGSLFTSHVNHKLPGVELSTGSLGHALNVTCGAALGSRNRNENRNFYCIVSDGELNEGSNWEAILFAPHHKLKNLTLIVDYNKIQSFGTTKEVLDLDLGSSLSDKFEAFGWDTYEINGHNYSEIVNILKSASHEFKPRVIIAHTIKGKGVDFMENKLAWHYKSPSAEELSLALNQLI